MRARVNQKIVATTWWIYKGKISSFCAKANGNFGRKSKMADL